MKLPTRITGGEHAQKLFKEAQLDFRRTQLEIAARAAKLADSQEGHYTTDIDLFMRTAFVHDGKSNAEVTEHGYSTLLEKAAAGLGKVVIFNVDQNTHRLNRALGILVQAPPSFERARFAGPLLMKVEASNCGPSPNSNPREWYSSARITIDQPDTAHTNSGIVMPYLVHSVNGDISGGMYSWDNPPRLYVGMEEINSSGLPDRDIHTAAWLVDRMLEMQSTVIPGIELKLAAS